MGTNKSSIAFADADALQLRIGVDPIDRLRWALEFAEADDAQLTELDRETVRWQLALFQVTPIFWWDRLPTNYQLLRERFGRSRTQNLGAWEMKVPDDALIMSVRREFQKILNGLRTKGEHVLGLKFYYVIVLGGDGRTPEPDDFRAPIYVAQNALSRPQLHRAGGFEDEAVFKFAELLAGHQGALRTCAEEKCSRWFVDRKPTQVYCSPACQSRATTRAHRQRMAAGKGKR
jgi:hypothetical protein